MTKIILDLCGGTGSWSKPYKDAGYDVRVITLPMYNVKNWVITDGCFIFQGEPGIVNMRVKLADVYGILAAPPCTMFSKARSTAKKPRDYKSAMQVVAACMVIVWTCRENHRLKFWALENPMGQLRQFLGRPAMTFHPWQFGDPYIKTTDIWGYFEMPKKTVVTVPAHVRAECRKGSRNGHYLPKLPKDYILPPSERQDAARRSMTPPGFASAFYLANK